jgi:hypothetical protein
VGMHVLPTLACRIYASLGFRIHGGGALVTNCRPAQVGAEGGKESCAGRKEKSKSR